MVGDDESARLSALHNLGLLDTDPSESFDRITRMASQLFQLPIAAVSLTDRDRQWFKSRVGVDHTSLPREKAPCAAVAESRNLLVVPDLLADPVYRDSILADSGIRFYAGAPLVTRDGFGLGAMCVLGSAPREASAAETAALRDLAAMVMSQIELQHAFGRVDPVSGLPNRTQFEEDLEDLARDRRVGEDRVAVLVELATSAELNEAAHVQGPSYLDDLVRDAARHIRSALGAGHRIYHVGANQFAFHAAPHDACESDLDDLHTRLAQPSPGTTPRFATSMVMGIAPFGLGVMSPRDVLRIAQSAAYEARLSGRTRSVYSASQDAAHRRRFRLLTDFGSALAETDQLRLVFQPRIDLASMRCLGAETLLRWRHPELGDVSPAEFIPLVEQTPLARGTTEWVLAGALRQLAAWRTAGLDLRLSVNVSMSNLREADLPARVAAGLARHALPAASLELEVTESAVMDKSGGAVALLRTITGTGVEVAIDDFGTGYSSLSYLQSLPARTLKIDRSFVIGCETDPRKLSLISAMVTLAHDLDYRVVAEGVETAEALARIVALKCDEAQGYYFAHPMDPAAFTDWLHAFEMTRAGVHAA